MEPSFGDMILASGLSWEQVGRIKLRFTYATVHEGTKIVHDIIFQGSDMPFSDEHMKAWRDPARDHAKWTAARDATHGEAFAAARIGMRKLLADRIEELKRENAR